MTTMTIVDTGYVDLLVKHMSAKPRNAKELTERADLLESLAANEVPWSPAIERFIETFTALVMRYEEEIQPDPASSPSGTLKYLMAERGLRQVD